MEFRIGFSFCLSLVLTATDGLSADEFGAVDLKSIVDEAAPGQRLLQNLRERDALFDNVFFRYDKQRFEEIDLREVLLREAKVRMKRPNSLANAPDEVFRERMARMGRLPGPFQVEFSSSEVMTVRMDVVAFERTAEQRLVAGGDADLTREFDELIGIRDTSERWSNSEGSLRSSVVVGDDKFLAVATEQNALASIGQQRMATEFALGFGFGKRLRQIQSIVELPDGNRVVDGVIEVWVDDHSRCHLEIDKDLVVRKAVIHSDVSGNQHDFETTASGIYSGSDLPVVPKSGSFRKRWLGTIRNGELKGTPRDKDVFEIQLSGLEHPVGDVEFARLTTFSVDEHTTVRDVVKDETVQTAKDVVISVVSNPLRTWIVVSNFAIVAVIAAFVVYYNRKRRSVS